MRKLFVIALLALMSLLLALPAAAAPGATIDSVVFNEAACTITVTVTVEDAGPYFVQIWDDGSRVVSAGGDFTAGETFVVVFNAGPYGDAAAGIGIYVSDNATSTSPLFDGVDPYEYSDECDGSEWTGTVGGSTGATDGCANPVPRGSVVHDMAGGAQAFFEPRADAYAGFDLNPGTYYVVRIEGDFARVWLACQGSQFYVPIASVGAVVNAGIPN